MYLSVCLSACVCMFLLNSILIIYKKPHFQILNIVILVLYRFGYGGDFLGIGGTWNLNEEKSPDAEIIASGVYVGYLIYTTVQMFTFFFGTTKHKRELSDTIMNVVGVLLWLGVAGTCLHYWHGYQAEHDFSTVASERMVKESLTILTESINLN